MHKADFEIQINRVSKVFGKKGFEPDRVYTIWKMSEHMDAPAFSRIVDEMISDFSRIVDEMISDFRYAPLPKDFREAIQRRGRFQSEDHGPDVLECKWCLDSGLIEANNDELGFTAFVRCTCEAGKRNQLGKNLPFFTAEMKKDHKFGDNRLK
jgi:hypothetical protein